MVHIRAEYIGIYEGELQKIIKTQDGKFYRYRGASSCIEEIKLEDIKEVSNDKGTRGTVKS